jgi:membrane-associated phospholipid phosphatase
MLAATPIDGSHYFIDVLAGIIVATLSIFAARTIATRADHATDTAAGSKIPQFAAGE